MGKTAYLLISYGNNKIDKCVLIKDETYIGRNPGCDVVLSQAFLPEKAAEIIRKGDYYVIRALTDKGVYIAGEKFHEKILEKGDYTSLGDLRIDFVPSDTALEEETKKMDIKYTRKLVFISFLLIVIVFVFGNMFLKVKEKILKDRIENSSSTKEKEVVRKERKELSEQEQILLIAEVRRRDIIAEKLLRETNVNPHYYVHAINEWIAALKQLEYVNTSPRINAELLEKTAKLKQKVRKIVKYLQHNAFAANQQNDEAALKYLLENILAVIDNPADDDYIWAKKKYMNLIDAKKRPRSDNLQSKLL
jgi:hypothetical protein